ncbi:hypothetical protein COHA_000708 [Chlorella ohadii]|uniref:Uncharacterized protein n=1 Tax=Chlorella ohadii TaxID=2649997 RepID=A0AAD5H6K2_9CHLO|nr:hypothetical protein COHA_000708 [Chlorella ohadii]
MSSASAFSVDSNPSGSDFAVAGTSTRVQGVGSATGLATASNKHADAGSESSAQGFSPGDTASGSATSQTAAGEGAVDSISGANVQATGSAESHADTFGVGEVAGEGGTLVNGLTQAQGDAQGDPAGTGTGGAAFAMLHSSLTGNPPEAPPGVAGQAEASVDKSAAGTSSRAAGSMAGPQGQANAEGSASPPGTTSAAANVLGDGGASVLTCAGPGKTNCHLELVRNRAAAGNP